MSRTTESVKRSRLRAAAVGLAVVLVACGGGSSGSGIGPARCPTVDQPADQSSSLPTTVEELYAAAEHAYACPGMIVHLVEKTDEGGPVHSREAWVDVAAAVARIEEQGPGDQYLRQVIANGQRHIAPLPSLDVVMALPASIPDEAPRCFMGSAAVAVILPCPQDDGSAVDGRDVRLESRGGNEGVIDLVIKRVMEGSSEGPSTTTLMVTWSLDAATLLPMRHTEHREIVWHDDGTSETVEVRSVIEVEFVPVSSIRQGMFEPTSLGYPAAGPASALDGLAHAAGSGIYWLGERWEPPSGLPPLRLGGVFPAAPRGENVGVLRYVTEHNEASVVELSQIRTDVWGTGIWADFARRQPCEGPTKLANGGTFSFYCSQPTIPSDPTLREGSGVVVFDDAVIFIDAVAFGPPNARPEDMPPIPPFMYFEATAFVAGSLQAY
jgi:hypothetical protein